MARVRSPTLTTVALFVLVFVLNSFARFVDLFHAAFVLSNPVTARPWTLVTSVYAHAGIDHLVANSLALLVPGFVIERQTTPLRFHAFFVATGALAGVSQIVFSDALGGPAAGVLGASGAVFALVGYLLTANRLTDAVVGGFAISGRVQLLLFGAIAVVVTLATAAPRVALIAHFTGMALGLVAGGANLLRP